MGAYAPMQIKNKKALEIICPNENLGLFLLSASIFSSVNLYSNEKREPTRLFSFDSDPAHAKRVIEWLKARSRRKIVQKNSKKQIDLVGFLKDGSADWIEKEILKASRLLDELDELTAESKKLEEMIPMLLP